MMDMRTVKLIVLSIKIDLLHVLNTAIRTRDAYQLGCESDSTQESCELIIQGEIRILKSGEIITIDGITYDFDDIGPGEAVT